MQPTTFAFIRSLAKYFFSSVLNETFVLSSTLFVIHNFSCSFWKKLEQILWFRYMSVSHVLRASYFHTSVMVFPHATNICFNFTCPCLAHLNTCFTFDFLCILIYLFCQFQSLKLTDIWFSSTDRWPQYVFSRYSIISDRVAVSWLGTLTTPRIY